MERINELEKKIYDDYIEHVRAIINKGLNDINAELKKEGITTQGLEVISKYFSCSGGSEGKIILLLGNKDGNLREKLELYIQKLAIDKFLKKLNKPS